MGPSMPSVTSQTATATTIDEPATSSGTTREFLLAILWFGTSMYAAHATIKGSGAGPDGTSAFGAAAEALPGVVGATVLTGATIGQAAASRFHNAAMRLFAGLGLGALFGVVA